MSWIYSLVWPGHLCCLTNLVTSCAATDMTRIARRADVAAPSNMIGLFFIYLFEIHETHTCVKSNQWQLWNPLCESVLRHNTWQFMWVWQWFRIFATLWQPLTAAGQSWWQCSRSGVMKLHKIRDWWSRLFMVVAAMAFRLLIYGWRDWCCCVWELPLSWSRFEWIATLMKDMVGLLPNWRSPRPSRVDR